MIDSQETQRTLQQNKALHKFFDMLAFELNISGLDMRKVLKPSVDITWTKESVKTHLWKGIQDAMFDKYSTTELTTKQVNQVYEVLMRHLGEKFGIHVEFPTIES